MEEEERGKGEKGGEGGRGGGDGYEMDSGVSGDCVECGGDDD